MFRLFESNPTEKNINKVLSKLDIAMECKNKFSSDSCLYGEISSSIYDGFSEFDLKEFKESVLRAIEMLEGSNQQGDRFFEVILVNNFNEWSVQDISMLTHLFQAFKKFSLDVILPIHLLCALDEERQKALLKSLSVTTLRKLVLAEPKDIKLSPYQETLHMDHINNQTLLTMGSTVPQAKIIYATYTEYNDRSLKSQLYYTNPKAEIKVLPEALQRFKCKT